MKITYLTCLILFFILYAVSCEADERMNNSDNSSIALVPGGTFFMGSGDESGHSYEESPRHKVYVNSFYMDKHETSNAQFARFLNALTDARTMNEDLRASWIVIRNDLAVDDKKDWWPTEIALENGVYSPLPGFENYPVVSVSWFAADAYCKWSGKRLPTEAEWEKAGRGGLEGKEYPWGDELPTVGVNYKKVWKNNAYPAPVEANNSFNPNGYGLYNMAGNVAEWCSDWYNAYYYRSSPSENPKGPETGISKVTRGGSWASNYSSVRVGFRNYSFPAALNSGVGIRCVKDAD